MSSATDEHRSVREAQKAEELKTEDLKCEGGTSPRNLCRRLVTQNSRYVPYEAKQMIEQKRNLVLQQQPAQVFVKLEQPHQGPRQVEQQACNLRKVQDEKGKDLDPVHPGAKQNDLVPVNLKMKTNLEPQHPGLKHTIVPADDFNHSQEKIQINLDPRRQGSKYKEQTIHSLDGIHQGRKLKTNPNQRGVKQDHKGRKQDHQGTNQDHQGPKENCKHPKEQPQGSKQQLQGLKEDHQGLKHDLHGPKKNYRGPKEEQQGSKQYVQSQKRNHQGPKQDHKDTKQDHQGPKQNYQSPKQNYQGPKQNYQGPKNDHREIKQDHQNPKQDHQNPKQDHQDSKQDHQGPKQMPQQFGNLKPTSQNIDNDLNQEHKRLKPIEQSSGGLKIINQTVETTYEQGRQDTKDTEQSADGMEGVNQSFQTILNQEHDHPGSPHREQSSNELESTNNRCILTHKNNSQDSDFMIGHRQVLEQFNDRLDLINMEIPDLDGGSVPLNDPGNVGSAVASSSSNERRTIIEFMSETYNNNTAELKIVMQSQDTSFSPSEIPSNAMHVYEQALSERTLNESDSENTQLTASGESNNNQLSPSGLDNLDYHNVGLTNRAINVSNPTNLDTNSDQSLFNNRIRRQSLGRGDQYNTQRREPYGSRYIKNRSRFSQVTPPKTFGHVASEEKEKDFNLSRGVSVLDINHGVSHCKDAPVGGVTMTEILSSLNEKELNESLSVHHSMTKVMQVCIVNISGEEPMSLSQSENKKLEESFSDHHSTSVTQQACDENCQTEYYYNVSFEDENCPNVRSNGNNKSNDPKEKKNTHDVISVDNSLTNCAITILDRDYVDIAISISGLVTNEVKSKEATLNSNGSTESVIDHQSNLPENLLKVGNYDASIKTEARVNSTNKVGTNSHFPEKHINSNVVFRNNFSGNDANRNFRSPHSMATSNYRGPWQTRGSGVRNYPRERLPSGTKFVQNSFPSFQYPVLLVVIPPVLEPTKEEILGEDNSHLNKIIIDLTVIDEVLTGKEVSSASIIVTQGEVVACQSHVDGSSNPVTLPTCDLDMIIAREETKSYIDSRSGQATHPVNVQRGGSVNQKGNGRKKTHTKSHEHSKSNVPEKPNSPNVCVSRKNNPPIKAEIRVSNLNNFGRSSHSPKFSSRGRGHTRSIVAQNDIRGRVPSGGRLENHYHSQNNSHTAISHEVVTSAEEKLWGEDNFSSTKGIVALAVNTSENSKFKNASLKDVSSAIADNRTSLTNYVDLTKAISAYDASVSITKDASINSYTSRPAESSSNNRRSEPLTGGKNVQRSAWCTASNVVQHKGAVAFRADGSSSVPNKQSSVDADKTIKKSLFKCSAENNFQSDEMLLNSAGNAGDKSLSTSGEKQSRTEFSKWIVPSPSESRHQRSASSRYDNEKNSRITYSKWIVSSPSASRHQPTSSCHGDKEKSIKPNNAQRNINFIKYASTVGSNSSDNRTRNNSFGASRGGKFIPAFDNKSSQRQVPHNSHDGLNRGYEQRWGRVSEGHSQRSHQDISYSRETTPHFCRFRTNEEPEELWGEEAPSFDKRIFAKITQSDRDSSSNNVLLDCNVSSKRADCFGSHCAGMMSSADACWQEADIGLCTTARSGLICSSVISTVSHMHPSQENSDTLNARSCQTSGNKYSAVCLIPNNSDIALSKNVPFPSYVNRTRRRTVGDCVCCDNLPISSGNDSVTMTG